MPVDSCKSCKKPQWSTSEGRFLLAALLGPLCLTGVSMRLSHPTDNAKIPLIPHAVSPPPWNLCLGLARTPLSLSSSWNLKVGGDNIPSFDLVLVVLKRACFPLFLNFGIADISSAPGQTDLLNSSEALWEGTSELALQQNFTPFVYSECVPLKKSHT